MKGKIDKDGLLEIERGGKIKSAKCPFDFSARCGDWCAKFGEPLSHVTGRKMIEICHGQTLYFDEFEDERVNTDSVHP